MIHISCMECKTKNDFANAAAAAGSGWNVVSEIIEGSTPAVTLWIGQCRLCYAAHLLRWHEEQLRAKQKHKGLTGKKIKEDIDRMVGGSRKRRHGKRRR